MKTSSLGPRFRILCVIISKNSSYRWSRFRRHRHLRTFSGFLPFQARDRGHAWPLSAPPSNELATSSDVSSESYVTAHAVSTAWSIDLENEISSSSISSTKFFKTGALVACLARITNCLPERDVASLIVIEQAERFEGLIFGTTIQDFVGHHLQEFFVSMVQLPSSSTSETMQTACLSEILPVSRRTSGMP